MTTKEKILDTAMSLYNAQGTDTITIRHIAAELGISHSNLGYHYPSTKDIIRALFMRMRDELDVPVAKFGKFGKDISSTAIYQNVVASFSILERYRFILLDFASIARKDKIVRNAFREVMAKRNEQLSIFFRAMRAAGLMRTDLPDSVYDGLVKTVYIISNAWLPNRGLYEDPLEEGQAERYANLIFNLLIPYLTKKGLNRFKALLASLDLYK